MASVHVSTTNNIGHSVTLLMDDVRDAEMIDYLKGMQRREDLAKVEVKPAPAPVKAEAAAPKKTAQAKAE